MKFPCSFSSCTESSENSVSSTTAPGSARNLIGRFRKKRDDTKKAENLKRQQTQNRKLREKYRIKKKIKALNSKYIYVGIPTDKSTELKE